MKVLIFTHNCLPKVEEQAGCPMAGKIVFYALELQPAAYDESVGAYIVPDTRCIHTNGKLEFKGLHVVQSAYDWAKELSVHILDADGWRSNSPYGELSLDGWLTREEFDQRVAISTVSGGK